MKRPRLSQNLYSHIRLFLLSSSLPLSFFPMGPKSTSKKGAPTAAAAAATTTAATVSWLVLRAARRAGAVL